MFDTMKHLHQLFKFRLDTVGVVVYYTGALTERP